MSPLASPALTDRLTTARAVRAGLAMAEVAAHEKEGLIDIDALIEAGAMPRRTWNHAKKQGRLGQTAAQRVVRYIRIAEMARDVFGAEKADIWLKRPTKALDGDSPLSLLDTDEGARAVEMLLGRIGHGIAA